MTAPTAQAWDRPADRIRSTAEQNYASVRRNSDLTDTARQRLIAQHYVRTKEAMSAAQGTDGVQSAADLAAAKRAVFGIDDITKGMAAAGVTQAQMSFRDAQQRVQDVTSAAEALDMLDRADSSGDELMCRAIGNAALSGNLAGVAGLSEVAQRYLAGRPDKAAAVERLRNLQQPTDAATLFQYAVPKPSELGNLSDQQIRDLAASQ